MTVKSLASLIVFSLLLCLSSSALNDAADAAIRQAIKAAVLDGLNVVQDYARTNYWYYLQGSERVFFNVRILRDELNYIVIYKNKGAYYRVNSDLEKISWKPEINSFVKIEVKSNLDSVASISMLDSQNNAIDLTKQIDIKPSEVISTQTKSKQLQPSSTVQIIKPIDPSNQGFVVLSTETTKSSQGSLTSDNHF